MMIKYCGPAKDYSGYGEAVRHDISALLAADVAVTTEIPTYCLEIADFGRVGDTARKLEGIPLDYKIKILHVTPNVYPMYLEPGKYHIGRVFWETDKLPPDFAKSCQLVDEIWTGSEFNAQAIRNAGVTKRITIIPEAIDTEVELPSPYEIPEPDSFKFYSIFEWTERKNPLALLEAYWREFEHTEGVTLTIKTYIDNFTPGKCQEINHQIADLKRRLNLTRYAPLYLCRHLMDRAQLYRYHATFDCFVSAHRGEGWGIPQMEALLLAKPIISTRLGGIHEYLRPDVDAKLPGCRMVPVTGNSRNQQWYLPDQHWAEVTMEDLRAAMRWAFENNEAAIDMGISGKQIVDKLFSFKAVGQKMLERLNCIKV